MRAPNLFAALLCAGLATGPALASSTTIIDFTIEITEIRPDFLTGEVDPLFAGKATGDRFDGVLEMANPPVDLSPLLGVGLFSFENLSIDGFDEIFFRGSENISDDGFSASLNSGTNLVGGGIAFFSVFSDFSSPLDDDPDNLSVDDLLALLTESEFGAFLLTRSDGFETDVSFDVTSASIRPDTTVIPLPAAGWLMLASLGGLAALRRRA